MCIIYFGKREGTSWERWGAPLLTRFGEPFVRVASTVGALRMALLDMTFRDAVVMLAVPDADALREAALLRELLIDRKVVAGMEQPTPALLTEVHRLYPRYVAEPSGDPETLLEVMESLDGAVRRQVAG